MDIGELGALREIRAMISTKRIVIAFLLATSFVLADRPKVIEELRGKVLGVIDGDTLTLHTDGKPLSIRLEGIDAPESGQKYGLESRESLKKLVVGKDVTVRKTGVDKYKRILGIVVVDKTDVCSKQVEDGWAWHFKKYSTDEDLARLEVEARRAKRGLWQDDHPTSPWEYRDRKNISEPAVVLPAPKPIAKPQPAAPALVKEVPAAKYWITIASGIRHNERCQHYANSKGRNCGPNDGSACKKCGG